MLDEAGFPFRSNEHPEASLGIINSINPVSHRAEKCTAKLC